MNPYESLQIKNHYESLWTIMNQESRFIMNQEPSWIKNHYESRIMNHDSWFIMIPDSLVHDPWFIMILESLWIMNLWIMRMLFFFFHMLRVKRSNWSDTTGMRIIGKNAASGEVRNCSATSNPDLFYGSLGGLGQLGIITKARIVLEVAPQKVWWFWIVIRASILWVESLIINSVSIHQSHHMILRFLT